jgi:hypothetical protein
MNLIIRQPKRVFTFGCSFTNYAWSMWPEIIAYDLNIPLYNYGRSGAGNQFISNCITQAHAKHCFTDDDLVIVCWTNICREDRWVDGEWLLAGNIFSQDIYSSKWVKKFVDPLGYFIRDLSCINLVDVFLKSTNCQYHFLSMMNMFNADQWGDNIVKTCTKLNPDTGIMDDVLDTVSSMYKSSTNKINKSFYEILWNNDISLKLSQEAERFEGLFDDGHPWPEESLKYLEEIFSNHHFRLETKNKVAEVNLSIINEIKNYTKTAKIKHPPTNIWALPEKTFDQIIQDYAINPAPLPYIL